MICITMTYESICSPVCAVATVTTVVYVSHTVAQYLLLINEVAHQTYIDTVVVVVLVVAAPFAEPDLFSESLPDTHSELLSVFDEHISRNHCHVIHTGSVTVDINVTQDVKIADILTTLMKDCNSYFTNTLCQILTVPDMVVKYGITI
jgi:hypothetical protein